MDSNRDTFGFAMNTLPVGVFSCDSSGRFKSYNRRAVELWGKEPTPESRHHEFCTDLKFYMLDGTSIPHEMTPMMVAIRDGNILRNAEVVVERPDGTRFTASFHTDPIKDENGQYAGSVTVFVDVSKRDRLDASQTASDDGLSLQQFQSLMDSMSIAVARCGPDRRYLWTSPGYASLFGRQPKDMKGRSVIEVIGDEAYQTVGPFVDRVLRRERVEYEAFLQFSAGPSWRWIKASYVPTFGDTRALDGWIEAIVDITSRKRAEQALQAAKDASEAANQSKDKFLAVLSHELRTPLTPVLLAASSMENDKSLPVSVREDAAMIRENVGLETKLIDDLLDLSRINNDKLSLHLEPVDVNDIVLNVCQLCRPQIQEKHIALDCQLDEHVEQIMADSTRLQQVLWNVLENATKFTPERGSISVSTKRHGKEKLQIVIKDTGVGITPSFMSRIFGAFQQDESAKLRRAGGLGLGLTIAKALVELHGGEIQAMSKGTGMGSTISIALPMTPPTNGEAKHNPDNATTTNLRRMRLLVVEDHLDTAKILGRILRSLGHDVHVATSIGEAMAYSGLSELDLILSDISLPDGSGYDLMRTLKDQYGLRGIAMSGFGRDEDLLRSREAGFSGHIVKPIQIGEVERSIARVLNEESERAVRVSPEN